MPSAPLPHDDLPRKRSTMSMNLSGLEEEAANTTDMHKKRYTAKAIAHRMRDAAREAAREEENISAEHCAKRSKLTGVHE